MDGTVNADCEYACLSGPSAPRSDVGVRIHVSDAACAEFPIMGAGGLASCVHVFPLDFQVHTVTVRLGLLLRRPEQISYFKRGHPLMILTKMVFS